MKKSLPIFKKGYTGSLNFSKHKSQTPFLTLSLYIIGVSVTVLILFLRLFHLTILKGSYYTSLATDNRVKEVIIEAPRGSIFDRKGIKLVSSTKPNITDLIERATSKRVYYATESASHILGYQQEADKSDLSNDKCLNKLSLGDKVGKKGVEMLYECQLRGFHGKKLIEVDAFSNPVKTLNILAPVKGSDIQLALDSVLQQKAYELLTGKKGAVVGIKPQTGEVLVLASSPSYSLSAFEDKSAKEVVNILNDPQKPLFNRALEGNYPPGSTFKMFVASAGLEEGAIKKEDKITDNGYLEAGPLKFHNWYYLEYGKTDGEVDLFKSLARSNDIYYYVLGGKLGPEKIKKWAEAFGFQNKTGVGLNEISGIVPTSYWKEQTLKTRWFLGDTYNLSIGQGYVTASPIQVAMATSVFANNRYICQPQLLKKTTEKNTHCKLVPISVNTYEIIREGMRQVCTEGGTGHPFFDFGVAIDAATNSAKTISENPEINGKQKIEVGCKTGTAESQLGRSPHAWFTIFAPFKNPEIVLTVLIEEGGQGSDIAAPIAKEVLTSYFERKE